ncbi:Uncharacterized protein BM_BM564 [Brugia malayi]|uniref:Uncharacterized protein n=1 Tax=Brugia malayi TaxID=6279 RepID=A0A4E9FA11_BRUMA|nr:Uncharacterized protein BM_BM564 [Brugia malayi]VIO93687.1 Uncharacterized protein BM_BM564 [Brugia malayi]
MTWPSYHQNAKIRAVFLNNGHKIATLFFIITMGSVIIDHDVFHYLGNLEDRFKQTTQPVHDEIKWFPEVDTAEMRDQGEKKKNME